jgi:hypothetical protein
MRSPPRKEDDRLEEARLAGGVRAPDEVRPGAEFDLERGISTEVENSDRAEQSDRRYEVVRTGITT